VYPTNSTKEDRRDYRRRSARRSANYTTWDGLHDVYAPGVSLPGERAILSRILRGGPTPDAMRGIPSYRTTKAPAHPFGLGAR
jgi:hypothetical protein